MSLSVIPLTILGQITGVTGSGETALYQVSFKSIDGTPLYGVTAVWTDEQAEIEALAAQKPYGVWINPIDGTFTVKFAGYTYAGNADLTDPDVLTGITPIEFNNEAAGGGGSGNFSTCKLTVSNNMGTGDFIVASFLPQEAGQGEAVYSINVLGIAQGQFSGTIDVILFKGKQVIIPIFGSGTEISALSGNIAPIGDTPASGVQITGDASISFTSN